MAGFYVLGLCFIGTVVLLYLFPEFWHVLLSVFLGLTVAYIDVHSTEVSLSILLLLAFAFFLGYLQPAKPIQTALLFAVWLPLAGIVHLTVIGNYSGLLSEGIGSFIGFIPATVGSYLGAFVRMHSVDSTDVDLHAPQNTSLPTSSSNHSASA